MPTGCLGGMNARNVNVLVTIAKPSRITYIEWRRVRKKYLPKGFSYAKSLFFFSMCKPDHEKD